MLEILAYCSTHMGSLEYLMSSLVGVAAKESFLVEIAESSLDKVAEFKSFLSKVAGTE